MKWGVPAQGELLHKGSKNPWNHAVPGVSLAGANTLGAPLWNQDGPALLITSKAIFDPELPDDKVAASSGP